MKYKIIAIIVITVITLGAVLYDYTLTPKTNIPVKSSESSHRAMPAPDFSFTTIDDEKLKLSDLKGKVVILNFWASWCAPCVKEFPAMVELVDKFQGNVVFLAVSKDNKLENINRFLEKFDNMNMPGFVKIIWDHDKNISEDIFYVMRLPETIIIDKDMNMIRKIVGNPDIWESSEIYEYIESLI